MSSPPILRVKRPAAWLLLVLAGTLAAGWLAAVSAGGGQPDRGEVRRASAAPLTDGSIELARRYAPWVYHEVDPAGGRQDLPAPVDFDGNLDGDDNWENLPGYELVPTLYYAHLETETHHFLTFHVFHPRDWASIDLGLHMTHEGDGENLQVVVEKATSRVVVLFTQAHYRGAIFVAPGTGFADAEEKIRGEILLVGDDGLPSDAGNHPAVFIESQGHGIYAAVGRPSRVTVARDGAVRFERKGIVFRPAMPGETVAEPPLDDLGPHPYQLGSTTVTMWPGVRDGSLVGEGKLLNGTIPYADARLQVALPRYHVGDRFSGPFGADRGISPFAVDFGWRRGTLGALFFDPARRYAQVLNVPRPWSLEYVDYPFIDRGRAR